MILSGITAPFGCLPESKLTLFRSTGYVTYPLLTLTPLTILSITQLKSPFDLHVLTTPPAFVLSQDQTLHFYSSNPPQCILSKTRRQISLKKVQSSAYLRAGLNEKDSCVLKLAAVQGIYRRSCNFRYIFWLNC